MLLQGIREDIFVFALLLKQIKLNSELEAKKMNRFQTCILANSQDSEVEGDSNGDLQIASPGNTEAQQALSQFWPKTTEEIKKITTVSKLL